MHELALAEALVDAACRHARGRRVVGAEVRVGALRHVVPSALELAFALVAEGTAAEGAELRLEHVPARVACPGCGERDLAALPIGCPACGRPDVALVAGEELDLEWLEVEEVPVTVEGGGGGSE